MSRACRLQIVVALSVAILGVGIAVAGPIAASYHMVKQLQTIDVVNDLEQYVATLNQAGQFCLVLQVGGGVLAAFAALYAFAVWAVWFTRAEMNASPTWNAPTC